jgi:hypothetical protein
MTEATPNAAAVKPASPTAVPQPAEPPERWIPIKLDLDSTAEIKGLGIPHGQSIKLHVVAGKSQGMEIEFTRPLMTIGRVGGKADIQIDDPEVSRLHCALEIRGDVILLHDLRSTNGTFVDDSRVFAARLKKMSGFRIGSSYLQIDILAGSNRQSKA